METQTGSSQESQRDLGSVLKKAKEELEDKLGGKARVVKDVGVTQLLHPPSPGFILLSCHQLASSTWWETWVAAAPGWTF